MINLSYSGVKAANNCKRKYYWRYVRGIRRATTVINNNTDYGKLWHATLSYWFTYREFVLMKDYIQSIASTEEDFYKCYAMFKGYIIRWPFVPTMSLHEQLFVTPIRNPATGHRSRKFQQLGVVDMLALEPNIEIWLYEHKAISNPVNYIDKVYNDAQTTGYISGLRDIGVDVTGVVYDLAIKPRIKQKQNENEEDFRQRLTKWHQQPDAYHREIVYIPDRQIADWKADLWLTTQDLLRCTRNNEWLRNTERCFDYYSTCEYLPLCQSGESEALINAAYEPRGNDEKGNMSQEQRPF